MLITTTGPVAAVQLIRYVPDEKGRQTQTVPLSALKWMLPGETLVDVVYDRAMNIFLWTTDQGNVYAVQRTKANDMDIEPALLFRGHRFHTASQDVGAALRVAVNARFSLFAVCSADGELRIYTARDYVGNMPLTQTLPLPAPRATTGSPNVLSYSPDGYCLFAGYEQGWAMWSVFGKPGAASFHADRFQAQANGEGWLLGVCSLCWAPGGTSMLLVPPHESQIYVVDFARSALAGCYVQANLARALLQTSSELVFYRGHDVSDLTTISGKESLWHHARYPMAYLNAQWPIHNVLNHFVINTASKRINLVQVGQIAFHGIIRAPTRVRSVSWVLPDAQLRHGDPAQDVSVASVLILIDGKLVLLQPATSETGELKYEMRSVANEVEYYILMRDQMAFNFAPPSDDDSPPASPSSDTPLHSDTSLRDSLWVFCGNDLLVWTDVQDVLRPARSMSEDIPKPLPVPVDFYPLSTLLNKGVVLGAEPELIQRRDLQFTIHRHAVRTQLFLPYVLQHHLANADTPAALSICHHFCNLSYFPHALEILLHHVLDEEVERRDRPRNRKHEDSHSHDARGGSLLPLVLSFLQAATPTEQYLDTIVQCTRKTELQFWETLFAHLPPPSELFEQAMELGLWKTAGGYLLVLQALEASEAGGVSGEDVKVELYVSRLLSRAICAKEWELCTELTNFLMALDPTGTVLKRAVAFPLPSASSGKLSPKSSPGTTAVPSNEPHIDTVHQLDDSKSKQLHAMVNGFDLLTLDRAASHGPT
ncbi:hypothetical protein KEM52_004441 [Ascosphaera acerosa]|nr:hypothetical protein KEM52_004441 [Ascosphaera acerosa]